MIQYEDIVIMKDDVMFNKNNKDIIMKLFPLLMKGLIHGTWVGLTGDPSRASKMKKSLKDGHKVIVLQENKSKDL